MKLLAAASAFSILGLVGFQSASKALSFDLKDPKGVSGLTISIDSPLEPLRGWANGVSGSVAFNLTHPEKSTGKVTIDANTINLGSAAMSDATKGEWCLDVKKNPEITFEVTKIGPVKATKSAEPTYSADVTGNFTLHGVTKSITVPVTAQHLPGKLKARGGVPKAGDLLRIHSKFSINRRDFKIAPDLNSNVVGDKVDIDLAFVGIAITE